MLIRYHNAFVSLQGVHHMWIASVLDSINGYHHLNTVLIGRVNQAEHHGYQGDFPRSLECRKRHLAASRGRCRPDATNNAHCAQNSRFVDEPPCTKNKPHRVTKPARQANKARQSHNYRSRQKYVQPASMMSSQPEHPIHSQAYHLDCRHTSTVTPENGRTPKPRSRGLISSSIGGLQGRRETEPNPQCRATHGWAEQIFLQQDRGQAGQEGRMRKHAGLTGKRMQGEREPLCFYGGAFPRSSS
ncbi:hypothetical protein F5B22DRAFT_584646 [Xylaria bambusicola]|uniref:uncharacterized protein n=1 Tax=Xylaria bambusicola TaxID=326684 RepID=UPI002007CC45|nr:uncharacterized protein F5B22DRAFT_584646 [Xylaria bambusicola]KAI0528325.1 hypothetical protein F5B22DRAFT_584646 [Xylaria bambusicola]